MKIILAFIMFEASMYTYVFFIRSSWPEKYFLKILDKIIYISLQMSSIFLKNPE